MSQKNYQTPFYVELCADKLKNIDSTELVYRLLQHAPEFGMFWDSLKYERLPLPFDTKRLVEKMANANEIDLLRRLLSDHVLKTKDIKGLDKKIASLLQSQPG